MGCDYYKCKYLKIKFQYLTTLTIDLEIDNGYYNFSLDEDDPDYNQKYEEYVEEILNNVMEPIIIYDNNQFRSSKLEDKYKYLIDIKLKESNNNLEWEHIREIVKIENRYERE